jgi:purine-binding chemotaxis protein CheW
MNYGDNPSLSQKIRVPSNRYLRYQYARQSTLSVLAFVLGELEYGIELLKVQEICSYEETTRIANTPDFIKGVINLRGSYVPIIDLRMRFNLNQVEYNEFTQVIIINLGNRIVGIVVDCVLEPLIVNCAKIKSVPARICSINPKFFYGLVAVNDRRLILVDIEKLMSDEELMLDKEMAYPKTPIALVDEKQIGERY